MKDGARNSDLGWRCSLKCSITLYFCRCRMNYVSRVSPFLASSTFNRFDMQGSGARLEEEYWQSARPLSRLLTLQTGNWLRIPPWEWIMCSFWALYLGMMKTSCLALSFHPGLELRRLCSHLPYLILAPLLNRISSVTPNWTEALFTLGHLFAHELLAHLDIPPLSASTVYCIAMLIRNVHVT